MLYPIAVEPADGGWMVRAEVLKAPLAFKSAVFAEDAAWRLGRALAREGRWAEIELKSSDGFKVSRFLCPPEGATGAGLRLAQAYQAA